MLKRELLDDGMEEILSKIIEKVDFHINGYSIESLRLGLSLGDEYSKYVVEQNMIKKDCLTFKHWLQLISL
jgi:hypothetical protein